MLLGILQTLLCNISIRFTYGST